MLAGSTLLAGLAGAANDYPWADPARFPSGYSPLRFYYRNCTDFTAWRLNKQQGVTAAPWKFTWSTLFNYSGSNGNAVGWLSAAQRAGIRCDNSPALGAVAWWGASRAGGFGHVAIVTGLRSDGSVDVESYNGNNETWYPQSAQRAESYLHIADLASPPPPPPPPPPTAPSVAQYAGHLVQWADQKPSPVTTWLVGPDLRRTWIPDGGRYNWMKAAGAPGPTRLSAAQLDALPDRVGTHATTDQLSVSWSAPRSTRIWSTSGGYSLILQSDGNLVIYAPGNRAIWATRTTTASRLVMQADGNLVLYNSANGAVWNSRTNGHGRARLVMQADGNAVVYRADGRAVWHTGTDGGRNRLAYPAGIRI